jgi:lambda repressor-like predicted transcriptional regulator
MGNAMYQLSEEDARNVVARIQARSSIFSEAKLRGIRAETLRRALVRVVGAHAVAALSKRMGPASSKISDKQLRDTIARLKKGSSIHGEARRLGCYHATLRKHLRALLGEDGFAALPLQRKKHYTSEQAFADAIARVKAGGGIVAEARRIGVSDETLKKRIRAHAPELLIPKVIHPGVNELPETCDRDQQKLKAGTDGNGATILWCPACGHTERVKRQHAPKDDLAKEEQRDVARDLSNEQRDQLAAVIDDDADFREACRLLGIDDKGVRASVRYRLKHHAR